MALLASPLMQFSNTGNTYRQKDKATCHGIICFALSHNIKKSRARPSSSAARTFIVQPWQCRQSPTALLVN